MAVPSVPPAPGRFSTTMDWPSSAARRSNTSRGTTSVALPAPNGIVALIRRDGQFSACAAAAKCQGRHEERLRIDGSDFTADPAIAIGCKNRSG